MPFVYPPEVPETVCRLIAQGLSVREIGRIAGMPTTETIYEWVRTNRDGFSAQYARAREAQSERFAEELLEIADDASNDWMERNNPDNPGWQANGEHIQRSRLRSDNRKWLMARMAPRKWGDKVTLSGDPENPVNVLTQINLVPVEPIRRLNDDRDDK